MKKLLSLFLALVMLVSSVAGLSMTANAAVYYDTDKYSDTVNYKTLTIYGKNHYKYAFDFLNRVNSYRTNAGVAKLAMDKDLLDAAMLSAHEIVVHYDTQTRANGEFLGSIVDGSSNWIYYVAMCTSKIANAGATAADYLYTSNFVDSQVCSAGVGAFESEETGLTYYVIFLSGDEAQQAVTVNNYSTSVSKSEKVALYKDYWNDWKSTHKHTYNVTSTTAANASKKTNGKINKKCKTCGATAATTVYYPKTVTLSATSFTYDGKVKKPVVTVKDSKGNKISSSNYTVSYAKGRKAVGKYNVTVKFKGNYTGTITKSFTIKPKSTSISKLTAGKKKMTVKWKKQASQTTGYEIQYSTSSKFTAKTTKTVTVSKNKTTSKSISKLKAKKKYYVRIRTYKTVKVNGKNTKIYSSWSKAKNVKIK
ncbi:MAG: CAP domain-containing protein [Acetobacter sp.]|nr:CAP domain-containing protein [Bacteroides sp.]MCM1341978.1 CAP domain-containing protein [Acetobacter sp.]MCM1434225.1 CAP domain-containing protein [Clostridiales bacterium]